MKKIINTSLLTVKEMYRADQDTMSSGISGVQLMESAGASIVREIRKRWSPCKAVILCGPGNNGGDGFVIARLLESKGWSVRVLLLSSKENLQGDAKINADRWPRDIKPLSPEHIKGADLIVDAIFGAGLIRDVTGTVAETLKAVEEINVPVVAVDIPTGVQGDSGQILGTSIQCDLTITFCRAKTGHYLLPGRTLCGELVVTDIGIPDRVIEGIAPKARLNGPAFWLNRFPWPKIDSHKYQRGHGVILGGTHMTGAARLAALSARRVGAGLITINASHPADEIYRQAEPGNLVSSESLQALLEDTRKNVVLAGPGLGLGTKQAEMVSYLLSTDKSLVLDADALSIISNIDNFGWPQRKQDTILTPHEGEFSRLFPDITGSKIERAAAAAVRSNCIILLKGPDTVIAAPNGQVTINTSGTPWLATAGSGDVLAGLCLGLMAQGLGGYDAGCISAWLHGRCAEEFGEGLIAEDISTILPLVLKSLNKVML